MAAKVHRIDLKKYSKYSKVKNTVKLEKIQIKKV